MKVKEKKLELIAEEIYEDDSLEKGDILNSSDLSTEPNKKTTHISDNELTHSMAHYLLAIHKLKDNNGYARVTDIAKEMNLTKGSVSIALNNLKKKKLILEGDNKFFSLSEKGHKQVHSILTSRTLLYYFLKDFIGVTEETAHRDSCLMEHLISDETRNKFFDFMKNNYKDKNTLNMSEFSSYKNFMKMQIGDSYLKG